MFVNVYGRTPEASISPNSIFPEYQIYYLKINSMEADVEEDVNLKSKNLFKKLFLPQNSERTCIERVC